VRATHRRNRTQLRNLGLDALSIVVVGLLIFPILWLYLTALKPQGRMFGNPLAIVPRAVTLDNFARIWNAVGFQDAFRNSLIVAGISAVVVTVAGIAGQARAVTRLRVLVFGEVSAERGDGASGGPDGDGAQSSQEPRR
jgi:ABC-type glycerol-3-phosphate transport system permease component